VKLDLSGLDAFQASALPEPVAPAQGSPMAVALELIDFDAEQPRRGADEKALRRLAGSMRELGVLEPVSLRTHPSVAGRFVVNRGERRVRAARLAGLVVVPAFLDERLDRYAQVLENLQRAELSPFDLARFVAEREREGESRAAIARRLHKPASFVSEVAGLIGAPQALRAAFEAGRVRDTRVLYRLAREGRERPEALAPLLSGAEVLTRDGIGAALRMQQGCEAGNAMQAGATGATRSRVVRGTQLAHALLVEHAGQRGRLRWSRPPGGRTAAIQFDDGSRRVVGLEEIRLIEWAG
jgi:ParB family transcriptional regulator, chromosome partitioning protein